jgi:DNA-directed RNA polymerase sigma subunit (sigma70/sigma32)
LEHKQRNADIVAQRIATGKSYRRLEAEFGITYERIRQIVEAEIVKVMAEWGVGRNAAVRLLRAQDAR